MTPTRGGMDRTRLAPGENAATHDRSMSAPVVLQVASTPVSPALVLRPWRMEDAVALVEVSRNHAFGSGRALSWSTMPRRHGGCRPSSGAGQRGTGSASPPLRHNPTQLPNSWWATWSSRKSPPADRRPRWATGPRRTLAGGEWPPRALEARTSWAFDRRRPPAPAMATCTYVGERAPPPAPPEIPAGGLRID